MTGARGIGCAPAWSAQWRSLWESACRHSGSHCSSLGIWRERLHATIPRSDSDSRVDHSFAFRGRALDWGWHSSLYAARLTNSEFWPIWVSSSWVASAVLRCAHTQSRLPQPVSRRFTGRCMPIRRASFIGSDLRPSSGVLTAVCFWAGRIASCGGEISKIKMRNNNSS